MRAFFGIIMESRDEPRALTRMWQRGLGRCSQVVCRSVAGCGYCHGGKTGRETYPRSDTVGVLSVALPQTLLDPRSLMIGWWNGSHSWEKERKRERETERDREKERERKRERQREREGNLFTPLITLLPVDPLMSSLRSLIWSLTLWNMCSYFIFRSGEFKHTREHYILLSDIHSCIHLQCLYEPDIC